MKKKKSWEKGKREMKIQNRDLNYHSFTFHGEFDTWKQLLGRHRSKNWRSNTRADLWIRWEGLEWYESLGNCRGKPNKWTGTHKSSGKLVWETLLWAESGMAIGNSRQSSSSPWVWTGTGEVSAFVMVNMQYLYREMILPYLCFC